MGDAVSWFAVAAFSFVGYMLGTACARWRERDIERDVRALAERLERLERRARKCGI